MNIEAESPQQPADDPQTSSQQPRRVRWQRYFPKDAPYLLSECDVAVECDFPQRLRLRKKAVELGTLTYSGGPPYSFKCDLYFRLCRSFREWQLVAVDYHSGADLGEPGRVLKWVVSSLPARLRRSQALALFTVRLMTEPHVWVWYKNPYTHYFDIAKAFIEHMKAQGWNTEFWEPPQTPADNTQSRDSVPD